MAKTVIFGNVAPTQPLRVDDETSATEVVPIEGGPRETIYTFPDDMSLGEVIQNVSQTWHRDHSGDNPEFVYSDSEALETIFADQYGASRGNPENWEGVRVVQPTAGGSQLLSDADAYAMLVGGLTRNAKIAQEAPGLHHLADLMARQRHQWDARMAAIVGPTMLRVDAGRDFQSRVMGDTASNGTGSYAPGTYIALSANTTAPSAASTTLPGEITTAGGGLLRAQAAYAHTAGSLTYTLIKTFTANASDSLPVTVAKIGVFNAATTGTLIFETLLNATATLSAVGDQLQVTETVTI